MGAVIIAAILIAAVEAIFIAATEALAKVVVVGVLVNIIASIAVVCVLIGVGVLVAGTPAIHPVCLSRLVAFRVTVVHGLPEQVYAILICLVVDAATIVSIVRSRVEERITVVIMVAIVLETYLLLTHTI